MSSNKHIFVELSSRECVGDLATLVLSRNTGYNNLKGSRLVLGKRLRNACIVLYLQLGR